MLILARDTDQDVVLIADGKVLGRVCVVEVSRNGKVRLGFEFSRNVSIHRPDLEAGAAAIAEARKLEHPNEP